jgi:hypothetical protein
MKKTRRSEAILKAKASGTFTKKPTRDEFDAEWAELAKESRKAKKLKKAGKEYSSDSDHSL